MSYKRVTEEMKLHMQRFRRAGMTFREIAAELSVNIETVVAHLRLLGISRGEPGRPKKAEIEKAGVAELAPAALAPATPSESVELPFIRPPTKAQLMARR